MEHTVETAIRVGRRHPDPVLDLEELVTQIEGTLGAPLPGTLTVGAQLRSRDDLFRVLNPWRGPLRRYRRGGRSQRELRRVLEAAGLPRRAWIVLRESRPGSEDRIREGVAAFARIADDGSLRSLLRLAQVVRQARALRARGFTLGRAS